MIPAVDLDALLYTKINNAFDFCQDEVYDVSSNPCKILQIEFTTAIAILIRSFEHKLIDKDEAIIKLKKLESVARYSRSIIEDAKKRIEGGE